MPVCLSDVDEAPPARGLPFFVFGIGVAAGALQAVQDFFRHVGPGGGVAFVVVQHVTADVPGALTDFPSWNTRLRVSRVEDGAQLAADCIYVTSPDTLPMLEGDRFRVVERAPAEVVSPFNLFLQSLALTQGDQCGTVIFNGTGLEGVHAAHIIREAGGLVMAQELTNVSFDAMPTSAMISGAADLVGSPRQLAARLRDYVHDSKQHAAAGRPQADQREALDAIVQLLRQQSTIDFTMYKPSMVLRRAWRRTALSGQETLAAYVTQLRHRPRELEQLRRELLVGVTQFFRDAAAWRHLADVVIPELVTAAAQHGLLRLWVAGCSTGEEAYTLAMLVQERVERLRPAVSYRVFATDVRRDCLQYARKGVYPASACEHIPPELREKYFEPRNGELVAKLALRDVVTFAPHDLLSDPPLSHVSLIVCRNTLIYFRNEARRHVLSRFQSALVDGGFLFLGPSELGANFQDQLQRVDRVSNLLVKRASTTASEGLLLMSEKVALTGQDPAVSSRSLRTAEALRETAVQLYAPPGVAVDADFQLLCLFGRVADIVDIPPDGLRSLLEVLPRSVNSVLSAVGRRALSEGEEIAIPEVALGTPDKERRFLLRVVPVNGVPGVNAGLLIFFEPSRDVETSEVGNGTSDAVNGPAGRGALDSAKQTLPELERRNDELEAANQALKASNAALEATNEELQSVNEELYTVNAEYQRKVGGYEERNEDLENLLKAVDAGILLVDEMMAVRRFNAAATRLFPLRDEDLGRPLSEIAVQAEYRSLVHDVREVLETGSRKSSTVLGNDGAWWNVGIRMARSSHNHSGAGAIVTMQEVSELKRALSELSRLRHVHELAESAAGIGHAVLDLAEEVVHYSDGARKLLGLTEPLVPPSLEAALPLFTLRQTEGPGETLARLRSGRGLPCAFERTIAMSQGQPVRLGVHLLAKTDPVSHGQLILALLKRA